MHNADLWTVFEERILTKKKRHSGPAKRARASARREQIEADKKRRANVQARLVDVSDQGTAGTAGILLTQAQEIS